MKARLTEKALGRMLFDWVLIRLVPGLDTPPRCAWAKVVQLGSGSKPLKTDNKVLVAIGDTPGFALAEKDDGEPIMDVIGEGEEEKRTPATFLLIRENQIVAR